MIDLSQNHDIQDILLGISANILTSLLTMSVRGVGDFLSPAANVGFEPAKELANAVDGVAQKFEWQGPGRLEEVCLFIVSPETASIMRQVFSAKLLGGIESIPQIEDEFVSCLAHYLEIGKEEICSHAQLLFREVFKACEETLNTAINSGVLGAHEIKSSFRHNVLLDEIATIKKNIAFLGRTVLSVKAALDFEQRYRILVSERHADIIPPNFDTARRIPIDKLYVPPNLASIPREKGEESRSLTIDELKTSVKRGVILGNPGGGKSTLAQRLVYDLTTDFTQTYATPILIVLRDFGAAKKERHCSLLQYIEICANATYQIQPAVGAFEYLLLNGRGFVIFDGLDELLDTTHRQQIAKDIELFSSAFPSARLLVTSRQVGYEQAPLDAQKFDTFLLEPFSDEQVKRYATNWFCMDRELTPEQQSTSAAAFYAESRIVADLCTNPLMLALMCNIYRGENYIPSNRPDVYEKCALMLFERWDKGRGIRVPLPIDAHVRPAMMYLAHWIYSDEALQSGVTEARLVAKTSDYLCPKRFEDIDEARRAAEDFIAFCRGRAWVFTDTGTTKDGDRLYQFTHRTFLEYFTAAQLVRTNPTPDRLLPVLIPRIAKREWDVVAQLSFQIQNKHVEGAADELLLKLLEVAASNLSAPWSYLAFASRCLEFLVPSPKIIRELSILCIDHMVRAEYQGERTSSNPEVASSREALAGLMAAALENRKVVEESVLTRLEIIINGTSDFDSAKAIELVFHMDIALRRLQRRTGPAGSECWKRLSEQLEEKCRFRVMELVHQDVLTAVDCLWRKWLPMSNLLQVHGAKALFSPFRYRVFPGIRGLSVSAKLISRLMQFANFTERECDPLLKDVAEWMIAVDKPLAKIPEVDVDLLMRQNFAARLQVDSLYPDEAFALFTLFAVAAEAGGAHVQEELLNVGVKDPWWQAFVSSLEVRLNLSSPESMPELPASLGFNKIQQDFVQSWATGQMSLVGKRVKTRAAGRSSKNT